MPKKLPVRNTSEVAVGWTTCRETLHHAKSLPASDFQLIDLIDSSDLAWVLLLPLVTNIVILN